MKWIIGIILLVVILGIGTGWLAIRTYLPVNPAVSYFPGSTERLGVVHWNLGEFQPVYLYSFTSGNNYFIKVAYRDAIQNIKLMDIFVGKSGVDSIPLTDIIKTDGSPANISAVSDYGKYFRIGNRIHITYLRNIVKRSDQPDIVAPDAESIKGICDSSKMLCYSISLLQSNQDIFWNFAVTGDFPSNMIFPGFELTGKLLNQ